MKRSILAFSIFIAAFGARADNPNIALEMADALENMQAGWMTPLEQFAQKMRTQKPREVGGEWYLGTLYAQLTRYKYPPSTIERDDAAFGNYVKILDDRVTQHPESVTHKVAAAMLSLNHASDIKEGYTLLADDAQKQSAYKDGLNRAERYLLNLDGKEDPYIRLFRTTIALAKEKGRQEADALYNKEITDFPDFPLIYASRATYLREEVNGKNGELQSFLSSLALAPGGENGDYAYAAAATELAQHYSHVDVYPKTGLEWPLVQKAFTALEKNYGLNDLERNAYLSLAVSAKDKATALRLSSTLKKWDAKVWQVYHYYADALKWIAEKDPQKAEIYWAAFPYDPQRNAERKLMLDDFNWLEGAAKQLRETDARREGGWSALSLYYIMLGATKEACFCQGQYETPYTFKDKLPHLEKWLAQYPQSIAARIAMAEAYLSSAYAVRGGGDDQSVTTDRWEEFIKRLQKSGGYIKDIDPKADPAIFALRMVTIPSENKNQPSYSELYRTAVLTFPSHFEYYQNYADELQPSWYGKPDPLRNYVASLDKVPGGEPGLIAISMISDFVFSLYIVPESSNYSYIYGRQRPFHSDDIVKRYHLDWVKIKKSYDLREKRYGLNNHDWNRIFDMAISVGDPEFANKAFAHITERDPDIFRTQQIYLTSVAWTLNNRGKTIEKVKH